MAWLRIFVLAIMLVSLEGLTSGLAWAETEAEAEADNLDNFDIHVMEPQKIIVDYAVQNGHLKFMFYTTPPLTGCGDMTDLTLDLTYDTNAVDIRTEPFAFIRPKSGQIKDCGPAYKVAQGKIAISADQLAAHEVERIRLWYGTIMDTLLITREGQQINVQPMGTPKLFNLGNMRSSIDTPVPEENKTPQTEEPKPDLTGVLMVSTGNDPLDLELRSQIKEIAVKRGLTTTDDPDLYLDQTGEYYQHLETTGATEIGAIMHNGKRVPILAVRLDKMEAKE